MDVESYSNEGNTMSKRIQRDDEAATPDQLRAQEKREAGERRAAEAAKATAEQEWPPAFKVVEQEDAESEARTEPPKGRRSDSKSKA